MKTNSEHFEEYSQSLRKKEKIFTWILGVVLAIDAIILMFVLK